MSRSTRDRSGPAGDCVSLPPGQIHFVNTVITALKVVDSVGGSAISSGMQRLGLVIQGGLARRRAKADMHSPDDSQQPQPVGIVEEFPDAKPATGTAPQPQQPVTKTSQHARVTTGPAHHPYTSPKINPLRPRRTLPLPKLLCDAEAPRRGRGTAADRLREKRQPTDGQRRVT
jgi:hypothetical protein